MSIGSFILIRNEVPWVGPHLASWLPWLDEMVFLDGNSTDGTLEIIKEFRANHPDGHKITLVEDRDPKNLQHDYVRLFNEALRSLMTDWAFFLHPDMLPVNPEALRSISGDSPAFYTHMRSFGGEPGGQLLEISGRGRAWKNIYRLRNPDLGAHYHGFYGAHNEDVYLSEITGDEHIMRQNFADYPYEVKDSGLNILHFSDVRPLARRISRMRSCLENNQHSKYTVQRIAETHPRVTFKNGTDPIGKYHEFKPAEYPPIFTTWRDSLKVPA